MLNLLHLSDLHLGYSYSQKPSAARLMNDELVRAFERAVSYCIADGIDILLLAGDVFHRANPSYATERIFLQALRKLDAAGVVVVYCGGNHDPKGSLSQDASYRRIPSFVPFVRPEAEVVRREIRGISVCFVGSGYEGKQRFAKIVDYPRAADLRTSKDHLVIGVSHLSVDSKEAILTGDVYNATRLVDLESLGYDYFALGHIHVRQVLGEQGAVAYSGNLQGLHIGETGKRGGLRVTFVRSDDGEWKRKVETVDFSGLCFEQDVFDVSGCRDLASLEYELEEKLRPHAESGEYRYVRLRLEGQCSFFNDLLAEISNFEMYLARGNLLGVEIQAQEVRSASEIGEETLGGLLLEKIRRLEECDLNRMKREGILHKNDDLSGLIAYLSAQVHRKLR